MERFRAEIDQVQDVVAVRLTGELDANTAVSADDALQEAIVTVKDKDGLLIDCTALQYISSAGLGVILSTLHTCNHNHTKVAFFGLQPKIKNVFSILGLEKIILSAESEAEAIQLLNDNSSSSF